MVAQLGWGLLFLGPLFGSILNGLWGNKFSRSIQTTVALSGAGLAFLGTLVLTLARFIYKENLILDLGAWFSVFEISLNWSFKVDPLSVPMMFLVTGVGFLIHVFATEYMAEDEGYHRFFAYLNFFLLQMLILVTAQSLPVLFVGWEGVGLASYLLIGFWYEEIQNAKAGLKAFVTNRVGDAFFVGGMFCIALSAQTLEFDRLNQLAQMGLLNGSMLGIGLLLLFLGATGKSAQFPLYVWLPDAMAGPTPVSALIHAATMVTAGVFLILRLNHLFMLYPWVLHVIAAVGLFTALLGGFMGLLQWDIKKILAFSTMSQLGFMFLACGVGAFVSGFFHLLTHGFFKALLFLGAGAIIHALGHQQDIRVMGGLNKKLNWVYWVFLVGWLSILGIPPLSGFFSKDEILMAAYGSVLSHPLLGFLAQVAAWITVIYMTRLMVYVFWKPESVQGQAIEHYPHFPMLMPLVVLALLSALGGLLGLPSWVTPQGHFLSRWLSGVAGVENLLHHNHTLELALMIVGTLGSAILAILVKKGLMVWISRGRNLTGLMNRFYNLISNRFYLDAFYDGVVKDGFVRFSFLTWSEVDKGLIDGFLFKLKDMISGWARLFAWWQSGQIQDYIFWTLLAFVILLFWMF